MGDFGVCAFPRDATRPFFRRFPLAPMAPSRCLMPVALLAGVVARAGASGGVPHPRAGWQPPALRLPMPERDEHDDEHARKLNTCSDWEAHWLTYLPTYSEYWQCVENGRNTANLSVVGTDLGIRVDCTCSLNIKAFVEANGCCAHPMWSAFCEIDCADSCQHPNAATCMDNCPALCLENSLYAPEACDCINAGYDCFQSLKCLTRAVNDPTLGGSVPRVCDDAAYARSAEAIAYTECLTQQPLRTEWHRHNAVEYCTCQADVGTMAAAAGCCGNAWASDMCTRTCMTPTNCSTAAAVTCTEGCRTDCTHIHPDYVSPECQNQCLTTGASCEQYSTCAPLDPIGFEYVCEDGNEVRPNGCCMVPDARNPTSQVEDCPLLCNDRARYRVPQPGGPYVATECLCYECPTSAAEVAQACTTEFLNDIDERGQMLLLDIQRRVGLPDITPSMQSLMNERNTEIDTAIAANNGNCDDALQADVLVITERWENTITREARVQYDCWLATGDYCVEDDTSDDDDEGGGRSTRFLLLIIIVLLIGGIIGGGVAWYCFRKRLKKPAPAVQQRPGFQPVEGDQDVVVGRPVEGEAAGASAAGGAPVAAAAADETAKGDSPPPQFGGKAGP